MKIRIGVAFATLALTLAACGSVQVPPPVVVPHNAPVPIVQPTPLQLKPVQWKVYTTEQLKALVAQLEAQGQQNVTFYVLSQDNFNSLAFNLTEMERYIKDQKAENDFLIQSIEINNGQPASVAKPTTTDKPIVTNPKPAAPPK